MSTKPFGLPDGSSLAAELKEITLLARRGQQLLTLATDKQILGVADEVLALADASELLSKITATTVAQMARRERRT